MQRRSRRLVRRFARVALCSLLAVACHARTIRAESPTREVDSSRTARRNAYNAVPFEQLTPEAQTRLKDILRRPSLYWRLPTQRIACDSDLHLFLLRHPEIIVNMWTMMGITTLDMVRTAPYELRVVDGKGTECDIELVYGTPNIHIIYGEGTYEGPVLRHEIRAKCVCIVRTEVGRNEKQQMVVTNVLDVFLQFDGLATELLAKTVHPLISKAAEHNFAEAMHFVEQVNGASERNGPGVGRMSNRLRKVDIDTRKKFSEVANIVHQRAVMREAAIRLSGGDSTVRSASNVSP